jgi:regulator of protease activity HflC (stomatin/prohibitin superfamily)
MIFKAPIGVLVAVLISAAIKIADRWEKGVVLRMGKFIGLKGPGPFLIIPIIDRVDNYTVLESRILLFTGTLSEIFQCMIL